MSATSAAANYDFAGVNGTLTVNPVSLTITASSQTKAYAQLCPH